MSSVQPLADAINALAPAQFATYDTNAAESEWVNQAARDADGVVFPRAILTHRLPGVVTRSEAGTVHARSGSVQVTMAAASGDGIRIMWDAIYPAFEGARVTAAGWLTTPLRMLEDDLRTFVDRDVPVSGSTYPVVGVATFGYTVTETD